MHPPDEFGFGAERGRIDLHPLQLGVDQVIDLSAFRHGCELEPGAIAHDHHLAGRIKSLVADQHSHFAASKRGERAVLHQSDLLVVAGENGLAGHIPCRTVGKGGENQELLLATGQIDLDPFRQDGDLRGTCGGRRFKRGTFRNPLAQQRVIP